MQLAQRLIKKGQMAAADLPRLVEAQKAAPTKPVHLIIVEQKFAKEEDVLGSLAEEFGMDIVDLNTVKIDPETLKSMPLRRLHGNA